MKIMSGVKSCYLTRVINDKFTNLAFHPGIIFIKILACEHVDFSLRMDITAGENANVEFRVFNCRIPGNQIIPPNPGNYHHHQSHNKKGGFLNNHSPLKLIHKQQNYQYHRDQQLSLATHQHNQSQCCACKNSPVVWLVWHSKPFDEDKYKQ